MTKEMLEEVNAELKNVLEVEDFVIEEVPALPLALRQMERSPY